MLQLNFQECSPHGRSPPKKPKPLSVDVPPARANMRTVPRTQAHHEAPLFGLQFTVSHPKWSAQLLPTLEEGPKRYFYKHLLFL